MQKRRESPCESQPELGESVVAAESGDGTNITNRLSRGENRNPTTRLSDFHQDKSRTENGVRPGWSSGSHFPFPSRLPRRTEMESTFEWCEQNSSLAAGFLTRCNKIQLAGTLFVALSYHISTAASPWLSHQP